MALINCAECGREVSDKAESCPHCGAPVKLSIAQSRTPPPTRGFGLGRMFIIVLIALAIALAYSNKSSSPEATPQLQTCRSDWTKCADNAELVKNYSDWTHIQASCQVEAADQAKYGTPEWPWLSFSSFYKGDNYIHTGIAIAIEPNAQFQNGFGAKVHSQVVCAYDLRAKRVTSVVISPR
jgi:hypothetical protein